MDGRYASQKLIGRFAIALLGLFILLTIYGQMVRVAARLPHPYRNSQTASATAGRPNLDHSGTGRR